MNIHDARARVVGANAMLIVVFGELNMWVCGSIMDLSPIDHLLGPF